MESVSRAGKRSRRGEQTRIKQYHLDSGQAAERSPGTKSNPPAKRTHFGRFCAFGGRHGTKVIEIITESGGGGNRRHSGLVRPLFARRDLTAPQPEILREVDPGAFLPIPRRAGWDRSVSGTRRRRPALRGPPLRPLS